MARDIIGAVMNDDEYISPALLLFMLRGMERGSSGRPLRGWKSVRHYERLVGEGLAVEVADENRFFRKFEITDAGRRRLREENLEKMTHDQR